VGRCAERFQHGGTDRCAGASNRLIAFSPQPRQKKVDKGVEIFHTFPENLTALRLKEGSTLRRLTASNVG
jgi:hypothetical protein